MFAETMTLNTEIQYFHKTVWLMMSCHQTKVCKRALAQTTSQNLSYFNYESSLSPSPLKIATQVLLGHSSSMAMDHHTTYGCSEDIVRTNPEHTYRQTDR